MDEILAIVVTAAALMMVAGIMLFIYGEGVGDFGDVSQNKKNDSQCKLWQAEKDWEKFATNCDPGEYGLTCTDVCDANGCIWICS